MLLISMPFHINSCILTFENDIGFDSLLRKEKNAGVMVDLFVWPFHPEQPLESSQGIDPAVQTCRNSTDMAQLEEMFCELMLLIAARCLGRGDGRM